MNDKSYLKQNGLVLRAPEPEDLACMYLFENNPSLWDVGNTAGPYSRFYLKQYIEQNNNDLYTDRQLRLMMELNHEVVGIIDICNFDPFHNRAEVGIVVAEEHRQKGIGKLALQLLTTYCFEYWGIHQLYAYMDVDNMASIQLFAGCGFKQSACLKDWIRIGMRYHDVYLMQLTQ